jgi:hypothetical protein
MKAAAPANHQSANIFVINYKTVCILISKEVSETETTGPKRTRAMPLILEAIFMSAGMLIIFFLAFLVLFLLALTLAPIEKGLSQYIWSHTNPPPPKIPAPAGSFRDFSKKH